MCVVCKKPFRVRPSYETSTCSRECKKKNYSSIHLTDRLREIISRVGKANKGRTRPHKPLLEKICEQCKTIYYVPGKQKASRYCSTKCWYNHIRQDPVKHPNWRGGEYDHNYGRNWFQQKRSARKRDKYTCQNCGITEREYGRHLDVHHKVPFRNFGIERYKEANVLKNLISLCRGCHMIAERGVY